MQGNAPTDALVGWPGRSMTEQTRRRTMGDGGRRLSYYVVRSCVGGGSSLSFGKKNPPKKNEETKILATDLYCLYDVLLLGHAFAETGRRSGVRRNKHRRRLLASRRASSTASYRLLVPVSHALFHPSRPTVHSDAPGRVLACLALESACR